MTNDTLDQQVREVLGRSVAGQHLRLDADPVAAVRRQMVRRRRRRVIAGAAVICVAVIVSSTAIRARDDEDTAQDLKVVTPPVTADSTVHNPEGVDVLPRAPIDVRGDAALVWTGAELVVWGGDVEASNMALPGPNRSYVDGAAFEPTTRTWRVLSPSPLPNTSDTPVGVMTEAGVLIARERSTALWDPDSDTWRHLDDAPAGVHDLVSTGSMALSYSANASLDIQAGTWRTLPAPPVRLDRPTTAWTGRELFVMGGPETPFTPAAAISYSPASNEWQRLAQPPGGLHAEALSADWDGERVVVVN